MATNGYRRRTSTDWQTAVYNSSIAFLKARSARRAGPVSSPAGILGPPAIVRTGRISLKTKCWSPVFLPRPGYTCGLSGKLHLSACNPSVTGTMERRINDGYRDFHWSHDSEPVWPTNAYHLWLAEKGAERELRPHPDCEYISLGPPSENHQTTFCAEKAIEFIESEAQTGNPWLFSGQHLRSAPSVRCTGSISGTIHRPAGRHPVAEFRRRRAGQQTARRRGMTMCTATRRTDCRIFR